MIVDARTERVDRRVRLYASDRFARFNGIWRPIHDAVSVRRDAQSGAYIVSCGDASITFVPAVRPKNQLAESVIDGRHFGDVLNTGTAPDTAEYTVRVSGRVAQEPTGWRFADVEGAKVGVFLDDWTERFGADKVLKRDDSASVDLRAAKTDGVERIDLDPTVTPWSNNVTMRHASAVSWTDAHDASDGTAKYNDLAPYSIRYDGIAWGLERGLFAFDTSGLPSSVTAATLYLTRYDGDLDTDVVYVPSSSFDGSVAYSSQDFACFGEVLTAYGTAANRIGTANTDAEHSYDVTSQYASETDWTVGVLLHIDATNSEPANETIYETKFRPPGHADEPYLVIELPSGPPVGTRMMMGMGC